MWQVCTLTNVPYKLLGKLYCTYITTLLFFLMKLPTPLHHGGKLVVIHELKLSIRMSSDNALAGNLLDVAVGLDESTT